MELVRGSITRHKHPAFFSFFFASGSSRIPSPNIMFPFCTTHLVRQTGLDWNRHLADTPFHHPTTCTNSTAQPTGKHSGIHVIRKQHSPLWPWDFLSFACFAISFARHRHRACIYMYARLAKNLLISEPYISSELLIRRTNIPVGWGYQWGIFGTYISGQRASASVQSS